MDEPSTISSHNKAPLISVEHGIFIGASLLLFCGLLVKLFIRSFKHKRRMK